MINDVPPLELEIGRWLVDKDETAELTFATVATVPMVTMDLQWGDKPRQGRTYVPTEKDLRAMHEWIGRVLGIEKE